MARQREKPEGFVPLSQRPDLEIKVDNADQPHYITDKFATSQRPKLKFQFTVTFKFRDPTILRDYSSGEETLASDLTFALKQASRPNPTIVYQDVNHYNYRTKVATKVDFGTMMLTLYDDVQNYAHNIYETYIKGVSPIANVSKERANNLISDGDGPKNQTFNSEGIINGSSEKFYAGSGSIGPLPPNSEAGIIENICIRHWFFSATERRGDENNAKVPEIQYVEYQFLNPKIVNMTLDELDMGASEASTIQMNFTYDSVFISSPTTDGGEVRLEKPETRTLTLNDARGRLADIERLYRRVRRLDTIPDIPVVNTLNGIAPNIAQLFVPPITGVLGVIDDIKPEIDLPDILDF